MYAWLEIKFLSCFIKNLKKKMLIDIFFSIFQSMIDKLFNLRKVLKDRLVFLIQDEKKIRYLLHGKYSINLMMEKDKVYSKIFLASTPMLFEIKSDWIILCMSILMGNLTDLWNAIMTPLLHLTPKRLSKGFFSTNPYHLSISMN